MPQESEWPHEAGVLAYSGFAYNQLANFMPDFGQYEQK
jgi:hypothetical protein